MRRTAITGLLLAAVAREIGGTNVWAGSYDRGIWKLRTCEEVFAYLNADSTTTRKEYNAYSRALAAGRLMDCSGPLDKTKLEALSHDRDAKLRVASILPLLAAGREALACEVFERIEARAVEEVTEVPRCPDASRARTEA